MDALTIYDNALKLYGERARLLYFSNARPVYGMELKFTIHGLEIEDAFFNAIDPDPDNISVTVEKTDPSEPSAIFFCLPIKEPEPNAGVPALKYYPSYAGMSPAQRFIYLTWLTDVTKPIEIGYVFVYYYGLERHLLAGLFDQAFDEILLLRRHHKNKSFQRYSANALVWGIHYRKREDRLPDLPAEIDVERAKRFPGMVFANCSIPENYRVPAGRKGEN